jgi:exosortase E/protease (VPEID-CTERM system)
VKRLALLAALFLAELLVLTTWLDGASLAGRPGLPGVIGVWGSWVLRAVVGFAAVFTAFAGMQGQLALQPLFVEAEARPIHLRWLYLHAAAAMLFAVMSAALYGNWPGVSTPNLLAGAWIATGVASALAAVAACLPAAFWKHLLDRTGSTWIYAATVALLAVAMVRVSQSLWQQTARLTFELVRFLVRPIFPDLTVNPDRLVIRAPNFGVLIDQACSGLEGAGLMLIFVSVWLILFRQDFKFPRSLLLIPAGVLTLYLLNAFRIAALIVIGNAGARQIAVGGFHSQAGWIAFNGVALAMTLVVPRLNWFRTQPREEKPAFTHDNPTAAYLLPFLSILVAGMLARAVSAQFEWLYGLRLVAAAGVLWAFRDSLRDLDWRAGWRGVTAGVAVFLLWVGIDLWQGTASSPKPPELAAAPAPLQLFWITLRATAAIVTVPIAEELAFRGFLMRRFQSAAFETVPLTQVSWTGVILSSVAFGFLHGDRWIAGVFAGLLYALVCRSTGRIGEAALAHGVTNALLVFFVIGRNQWQYW